MRCGCFLDVGSMIFRTQLGWMVYILMPVSVQIGGKQKRRCFRCRRSIKLINMAGDGKFTSGVIIIIIQVMLLLQVMALNKEKQQERTAAERAQNEHEKLQSEFAALKAEMDGARYQVG